MFTMTERAKTYNDANRIRNYGYKLLSHTFFLIDVNTCFVVILKLLVSLQIFKFTTIERKVKS